MGGTRYTCNVKLELVKYFIFFVLVNLNKVNRSTNLQAQSQAKGKDKVEGAPRTRPGPWPPHAPRIRFPNPISNGETRAAAYPAQLPADTALTRNHPFAGPAIGIDLGTTYSVRRVHHRLAPAAPLLGAGSPATLRLPPAQRRSAAATLQLSAEN